MKLAAFLLLATSLISFTPQQLKSIRKVEARIMAPCCYTQTILDHDSEVAAQMRAQVEQMVASGMSEEAIQNYYKARYGERILVTPDGWNGVIAWSVPWIALASGCAIVVLFIRRQKRAALAQAALVAGPAEAEEANPILARIRGELADDI